jgi:hypothetical protein
MSHVPVLAFGALLDTSGVQYSATSGQYHLLTLIPGQPKDRVGEPGSGGSGDSVLQIKGSVVSRGGGGQHAGVAVLPRRRHPDCGGVLASQRPLPKVLWKSFQLC